MNTADYANSSFQIEENVMYAQLLCTVLEFSRLALDEVLLKLISLARLNDSSQL